MNGCAHARPTDKHTHGTRQRRSSCPHHHSTLIFTARFPPRFLPSSPKTPRQEVVKRSKGEARAHCTGRLELFVNEVIQLDTHRTGGQSFTRMCKINCMLKENTGWRGVAQSVERRILHPKIGGSNLACVKIARKKRSFSESKMLC